jgi:hypothetical protein
VRAELYLSQYTLDIKHYINKNNIVPTALSRLIRLKYYSNSLFKNKNILENATNKYHYYNAIIIEISDKFKNKYENKYENKNK